MIKFQMLIRTLALVVGVFFLFVVPTAMGGEVAKYSVQREPTAFRPKMNVGRPVGDFIDVVGVELAIGGAPTERFHQMSGGAWEIELDQNLIALIDLEKKDFPADLVVRSRRSKGRTTSVKTQIFLH